MNLKHGVDKMEKICLDNSIVLDFLSGETSTVEKIKYYSDEELCTTSFTIFELMISVNKTEIVNQFIREITILPFNENCSIISSKIYRDLKNKGVYKSMRNIMNASICINNAAFLVTKNRIDYEKIRGLKLV